MGSAKFSIFESQSDRLEGRETQDSGTPKHAQMGRGNKDFPQQSMDENNSATPGASSDCGAIMAGGTSVTPMIRHIGTHPNPLLVKSLS